MRNDCATDSRFAGEAVNVTIAWTQRAVTESLESHFNATGEFS